MMQSVMQSSAIASVSKIISNIFHRQETLRDAGLRQIDIWILIFFLRDIDLFFDNC